MAVIKKILPAKTDQELVQQYRLYGDLDVLGELYARYMTLVYGVCLKYVKEPEEAKDFVMNIFEDLISKLKKYEVENFKGWLYQLSRNYCLMKLRSKKPTTKNIEDDVMQFHENNHQEDVIQKEMQLNNMENCIEQLTGAQKQAITLFYLQEKSYKEIAEQTMLDITTVRSFIQNGRRNLKLCMEKQSFQKA